MSTQDACGGANCSHINEQSQPTAIHWLYHWAEG